ncbi:HAMP domain-containing sensor histidine kinase [Enterococcus asini]|uniref:HAMP domain-containing sensor histidine kinase n=1 Tax=Enterococcus asini TaxID=57732 RepID=UPI001E62E7F0|nr:HAMP domain-containing sensor histidine kinase [Enterococcus asini]MCD5028943.1 HAMP domain-containing histidine kinase [Enterococcus asini]MDT2784027.1 HAMP domain-containing sensor histidine kinase [Enterococcus asini]
MKTKLYSKLWIYFVTLIFVSLVLLSILFGGLLVFLMRKEIIKPGPDNHLIIISIFTLFSIITGTGVAGLVGRRILAPIRELSANMNQVAKGDFSLRVNEKQPIQEVQQLFDHFNTMVVELDSMETLRNDFVVSVSHEFKTPLATIQGYVQLLQTSDLTPQEIADYQRRILEGTEQLATLTNNILRLTKLESATTPLTKTHFRLDEQIREVLLFLRPQWEPKNIQWELNLPRKEFYGNEELLYQVWRNLIDNSIKYSQQDAVVAITLTSSTEYLEICFQDWGMGIPEKEQKRVFDKFYQGDTSRKSAGNGLGLSLVREIVDAHEGAVSVTSSQTAGTRFFVRLPLG